MQNNPGNFGLFLLYEDYTLSSYHINDPYEKKREAHYFSCCLNDEYIGYRFLKIWTFKPLFLNSLIYFLPVHLIIKYCSLLSTPVSTADPSERAPCCFLVSPVYNH